MFPSQDLGIGACGSVRDALHHLNLTGSFELGPSDLYRLCPALLHYLLGQSPQCTLHLVPHQHQHPAPPQPVIGATPPGTGSSTADPLLPAQPYRVDPNSYDPNHPLYDPDHPRFDQSLHKYNPDHPRHDPSHPRHKQPHGGNSPYSTVGIYHQRRPGTIVRGYNPADPGAYDPKTRRYDPNYPGPVSLDTGDDYDDYDEYPYDDQWQRQQRRRRNSKESIYGELGGVGAEGREEVGGWGGISATGPEVIISNLILSFLF